jgi:alkanesulfonate monooxygenase SsuD/methylene tetrahydromethanopterin reductase-like flavin-dependent oxidoreductase (luciferase family)
VTTVGAIFRPDYPPEQAIAVARCADQTGLDELWIWEDCFAEGGISTAAAMLTATTRLRLGIGLLPAPLRNVALTAMELTVLERIFPGRLIPGIGHGVQDWMEQAGVRVESPITLLREYFVALRGLLSGEEVTTQGRYVRLDQVRLSWPPATPPPLYSGGYGANTLRLSGELADGTIVSGGSSPETVRRIVGLVEEGRGRAEVQRPHRIVVFVAVSDGPDDGEPGVFGSAQQVADGLKEWIEAGAGTVLLQPDRDLDDLPGFIRFAAEEVAPLLR